MLVHSPSMDTLVTFRYEPIKSGDGTVRVVTDERSMHSPPVADVTSQITKSCTQREAVSGQSHRRVRRLQEQRRICGINEASCRWDCGVWVYSCIHVMHSRSRMTVDPCIAIIAEMEHIGFSPTRHMLFAPSAKR